MSRAELSTADERPTAWVGYALKSSLLVLLLLPLLAPDLEQYEGKGMSWRVLVFPVACLVIPVLWRLTGSRPPYPYLADNLIVIPALADVLWNTLDVYEAVWGWDKANHLLNSMIFAAVIGLWAARYPLGPVNRFALALGLAMTLLVLWELGEYATFLATSNIPDLYADTIYDLGFDLIGASLGAAFVLLAAKTVTEEAPAAEATTALVGG